MENSIGNIHSVIQRREPSTRQIFLITGYVPGTMLDGRHWCEAVVYCVWCEIQLTILTRRLEREAGVPGCRELSWKKR